MIYDMEVAGDYFLLLCFHKDKWLHVFDKRNGEHIVSTLSRGRGPNEALMCIEFSLDKRRENISIFDKETKKLLTIALDSLINGVAPQAMAVSSNHFEQAHGVYPIGDEMLVNKGLIRMRLEDSLRYFRVSGDRQGALYYRYPVDPVLASHLYVDFRQSVSPDQTKMAVGTLAGTILECFDISEGIEPVSVSYFSEPLLDESERLDFAASGLGFVDLYGTDNYLYSSFGANKTLDDYNDIAIFDWAGNPLALHRADYNLLKICVESDDSMLYAIADNPESGYMFVSFPLHSH